MSKAKGKAKWKNEKLICLFEIKVKSGVESKYVRRPEVNQTWSV